jgi:hypothetical protein
MVLIHLEPIPTYSFWRNGVENDGGPGGQAGVARRYGGMSTAGTSTGTEGVREATTGLEPVNNGFADRRVSQLRHVAQRKADEGTRTLDLLHGKQTL